MTLYACILPKQRRVNYPVEDLLGVGSLNSITSHTPFTPNHIASAKGQSKNGCLSFSMAILQRGQSV